MPYTPSTNAALPYPHSTLYTRILGSDTDISIRRIARTTSYCSFLSHSYRRIFSTASRFPWWNTFLRSFGANTIWYLQFHFVSDKLFPSFSPI